MAAADQRACDLLLGSLKKNTPIEVVCGSTSQDIAERFRSAGFVRVMCAECALFQDWVANRVSSGTTQGHL
jgi:hypothetical protein